MNPNCGSRRDFLRACAAGGLAIGTGIRPVFSAEARRQPNIIVIMADDVGFECLGSYGGGYKTPNLDRLAARGMRFTSVFGSPVCSPTRIQLLTGQYAFRSGFIDICGRNGAPADLDPVRFPTLAQLLRNAGYATAACEKWHLGWAMGRKFFPPVRRSPHIEACGFDEQFCFSTSDIRDYGPPIEGKYRPDQYRQWTLKYLESRKGKSQPFFLYHAMGLCHNPWQPTPHNPTAPRMPRKVDEAIANRLFADMIEYLDFQVGQITRKLDELGMTDNTLLIFTSDNGVDSVLTPTLNGRPLRGVKMTLKDRASWVPLLVSFPGIVPAGGVCEDLTDSTDYLPTIADLAGISVPRSWRVDGRSLAPQLRGQPGAPRDFVHVQLVKHYFVRDRRWKLMDTGELYDVSGSPLSERKIEQPTNESDAARKRLSAIMRELHG